MMPAALALMMPSSWRSLTVRLEFRKHGEHVEEAFTRPALATHQR
jgi:hypothetical protein